MVSSQADVARVREVLASLVDLSGLSRREVERRLAQQGCGLDVSRLLGGKFELKLHQMLDIIRVLEIHPVELFRLIFKEPEVRSPLLERVQALFAGGKPQLGPRHLRLTEKDLDELRRRLDEVTQLVEQLKSRLK
jgi:hypothetical protein